jgi:hypothetical protein
MSQEEYDAWMKRFDAINQLVRDAELAALIELPIEIFRLVSEVRQAAYALYPPHKKSSQEV